MLISLLLLALATLVSAGTTAGPLRVSPVNPRYFTDDSGRAIYLTGSHFWANLQDAGPTDPPEPFDYDWYLDFMDREGHNFIRMWVWDHPVSKCGASEPRNHVQPFAWPRTGPGLAKDGKPKFDLSQHNEEYFDRLRSRVIAAGERGIYVSIMLFEGYDMQFCPTENDGHPFDAENNINGISPANNTFTLDNPEALVVQKAYVRKVVDTVNDLDNVLYEIANEAGGDSIPWQFGILESLNEYQSTKPRRHPVGMTYAHAGGDNATLFASNADWISPGGGAPGGGAVPYGTDPPAADGSKVIISDTDHIWGDSPGATAGWVWRSFTRGLNPIYMDLLDGDDRHLGPRRAMGQTLAYARRLDLVNHTPRGDLTSTDHCLANPGSEYLVYQPTGGGFTVDLGADEESYRVEWFRPDTGAHHLAPEITAAGQQVFTPPFGGDAVLYLRNTGLPPEPSIQVSIVDPADGSSFPENPASITINASARDRYGDIVQVELLAGSQVLGVSESIPFEFEWNEVPPGMHTLTARAINDSGESAVSSPVSVFVGSPPAIHLFSLNDGIVSFILLGDVGLRCRVEASEDLVDWNTLVETTLLPLPGYGAGVAVIVDSQSPDHPKRFYRASPLP